MVEKASTQQSGPWDLWLRVWRSDQLVRRCWIEEHVPERLGPQVPGWAAQENGKETLMAIRVGVNMLQFCSVSNSLSHTTLSNKVRGTYFSKELCHSLLCRCYDSLCIHESAHEYTTISRMLVGGGSSYSSAEVQSVYSTAPQKNWTLPNWERVTWKLVSILLA